MVDTALRVGAEKNALVTCGIVPTMPETGFGYIQAAEPVAGREGLYGVHAFHEKPNREKAEDFLAAGTYFWNSGMFFWTAGAFLSELALARPEMAASTEAMREALAAGDATRVEAHFAALEDISIDYALMEHARNVLMVRGTFPWADVGSWSSIESTLDKDAQQNAVRGEAVLHACEGCIVYNEAGSAGITVGVAGMTDAVVVVTKDAVLVVPKDRAQDVRHLVAELKIKGAPQV